MLPTKVRFIWPSGFRGEDFLEINQSEIRIACSGHDPSLCSVLNNTFIYILSAERF
jgi:hypothetical protein